MSTTERTDYITEPLTRCAVEAARYCRRHDADGSTEAIRTTQAMRTLGEHVLGPEEFERWARWDVPDEHALNGWPPWRDEHRALILDRRTVEVVEVSTEELLEQRRTVFRELHEEARNLDMPKLQRLVDGLGTIDFMLGRDEHPDVVAEG